MQDESFVCQVRGKYDDIERMLYKEASQYGKQTGDVWIKKRDRSIERWTPSQVPRPTWKWVGEPETFDLVIWSDLWSSLLWSGVLEAALERQKGELALVDADYKEASGFRWSQRSDRSGKTIQSGINLPRNKKALKRYRYVSLAGDWNPNSNERDNLVGKESCDDQDSLDVADQDCLKVMDGVQGRVERDGAEAGEGAQRGDES